MIRLWNPWKGMDARQREADYRATFGTPAGKRVLADILRRGYALDHATTPVLDPDIRAISEGRRVLAAEILTLSGHRPDRLGDAFVNDDLGETRDDNRTDTARRTDADAIRSGHSAVRSVAAEFGDPAFADGDD